MGLRGPKNTHSAMEAPPVPLNVTPLKPLVTQKRAGRKTKPTKPSAPSLAMNEFEQKMVEYVMYVYNEEYDLSESDQILLHLYAIEYIKYIRTIDWELTNDQQITMARQHPGARFDSLADRLGITRRHRLLRGESKDDPKASVRSALLKAFEGE